MAKGFTVKANTPSTKKAKKEEWDIAAIKERMKGKTIVFCVQGDFLKDKAKIQTSQGPSGQGLRLRR